MGQGSVVRQSGQVLLEALLAIAVAGLVLGGLGALLSSSSRSGEIGDRQSVAIGLAQEALEAAAAVTRSDWFNLYNLTKASQEYYPKVVTAQWSLVTTVGDKTVTIDSDTYSRWLIVENICRDGTGNIEDPCASGTDDPSTQKVTVTVTQPNIPDVVLRQYLTRWPNQIWPQTDWTGGSGQVNWSDITRFFSSTNIKFNSASCSPGTEKCLQLQ